MAVISLWLVVPIGSRPDDRLWLALWDLLHLPVAFLSGWLLLRAFVPDQNRRVYAVPVLLAVWGWFGLLEVAQPLLGRSRDLLDWCYSGGGLVLAGQLYFRRTYRNRVLRMGTPVLCGLLIVTACIPILRVVYARFLAHVQYPVIADFHSPIIISRWERVGCDVSAGGQFDVWSNLGKVCVTNELTEYPGIHLRDFPRNWTDAKALELDLIWSESEPRGVWVRWDDRVDYPVYAERYQNMFVMTQGLNKITIDRSQLERSSGGRLMDLAHVQRLGLFFDQAKRGDVVYIRHIRLNLENGK
jgi:hypothetical protein